MQFYIIVYHFCVGCGFGEGRVVDRFLINMELGISSSFTERRTYYGIHGNVSQFDLSFRIAGECSENYYGPQCNVFCSEVEGVSTCDSNGTKVCVNSNLSPERACTQCLEEGRDPANNCADLEGGFMAYITLIDSFCCRCHYTTSFR